MLVGVPAEIKAQESRVGLTPASVKILVDHGHTVLVENNAGYGAGFDNETYKKSGAQITDEASSIFNDAEMIVKVKEPLSNEVSMLRKDQVLFTYLHLAAASKLTSSLLKSEAICIA